jgi:hypothetical protein
VLEHSFSHPPLFTEQEAKNQYKKLFSRQFLLYSFITSAAFVIQPQQVLVSASAGWSTFGVQASVLTATVSCAASRIARAVVGVENVVAPAPTVGRSFGAQVAAMRTAVPNARVWRRWKYNFLNIYIVGYS